MTPKYQISSVFRIFISSPPYATLKIQYRVISLSLSECNPQVILSKRPPTHIHANLTSREHYVMPCHGLLAAGYANRRWDSFSSPLRCTAQHERSLPRRDSQSRVTSIALHSIYNQAYSITFLSPVTTDRLNGAAPPHIHTKVVVSYGVPMYAARHSWNNNNKQVSNPPSLHLPLCVCLLFFAFRPPSFIHR
jgi:hypothetical protein